MRTVANATTRYRQSPNSVRQINGILHCSNSPQRCVYAHIMCKDGVMPATSYDVAF